MAGDNPPRAAPRPVPIRADSGLVPVVPRPNRTGECPDAAIRIACRAGVPLRIAAKVDGANREYYESVIRPLLDHPLVEFLGEVDDRGKGELLRAALALLFPIDWPEPFGLVMVESLACGTPVIARRRGSVPEVIRDGVTGFICETEEAMVESVGRIAAIQRARCRAEFERRFTVEVMAQRYLQAYRALAGFRRIAPRTGIGQESVPMPRAVLSAALPTIAKETVAGAPRVAPRAEGPVA